MVLCFDVEWMTNTPYSCFDSLNLVARTTHESGGAGPNKLVRSKHVSWQPDIKRISVHECSYCLRLMKSDISMSSFLCAPQLCTVFLENVPVVCHGMTTLH